MNLKDTVTTPNAVRVARKAIRERFAELRAGIVEVRRLRATGNRLDREDADGLLAVLSQDHMQLQRIIRWVRTVRVEKYHAVSPNAAKRLAARHK